MRSLAHLPLLMAWSLVGATAILGCDGSDATADGHDGGTPNANGPIPPTGPVLDDGPPPPDATAPDAGPGTPDNGGSACAPSPEIYGNLKPLWSLLLGSGRLAGVVTDPSNNIIVAGVATGPITIGSSRFVPPSDAQPADAAFVPATSPAGTFVMKLDSSGRLLWHHWLSVQGGVDAVGLNAQGNIYVAGSDYLGSFYIAKLDPTGAVLWRQGFRTAAPYPNESVAPVSLAVDPAGGAVIIGWANGPATFPGVANAGTQQAFLLAVDAAGNTRYVKAYGGSSYYERAGIGFDPSGRLFATGQFSGNLNLGPPLTAPAATAAFVAQLNSSGQVQWQLADGTFSAGSAIAATSADVFVAGTFSGTIGTTHPESAQGPGDLFFAAIDGDGNATFETSFPAASASIDALAADPMGGVVAIGQIYADLDLGGGLLTSPGVLLTKLDPTGRVVFSARLGVSPVPGLDPTTNSVAVDTSGAIVAGGAFYGAIDLGIGVLGADPAQASFEPSMFVARYAQQAPPSITPRPACPLLFDGGLPDAGRLVATGGGDVALSPDAVYWTTGSEVMSESLAGGSPAVVALAQNLGALAIDSRSLYWTNQGGAGHAGSIRSLGLDGGTPLTLATGQDDPQAIAVDDVGVYWTAGGTTTDDGGVSAGSVLSLPFDGGAPSVLVTGLGKPGPIAVSNGIVVFASGVADAGAQIASIPRAGGASTVLATTDRNVASIAIDATTAYWADANGATVDVSADNGRIRSVPLAGGTVTDLSDNELGPAKLVVLGSTLYWSNNGHWDNGGPAGNAGLWSMPASGGTPVPLLSHNQGMGSFAIDANHLAWEQLFGYPNDLTGLFVKSR